MNGWLQFAVLTAVFVAFSGIGVEQALFGAVAAALAVSVNRRLAIPSTEGLHLMGMLRFIPYFLRISFVGGIDVARRAIWPSMPLRPGFMDYPLRLDPLGPAAAFFAAVISLIPGTLCVEHEGEPTVLVHVIDLQAGFDAELECLEEYVGAIFGESIEADSS